MQLFKQVVFSARLHESAPALATPNAVVSYQKLAKSVEAAIDTLGSLERHGAMVLIDVADPLNHTFLILALGLMGVPSASLGGTGSALPQTGPAPTLLLTDSAHRDAGSIPQRRVEKGWFVSPVDRPADYARLLALPDPAPADVVRYLYSSGTTGHRKCIAYTFAFLDNLVRDTPFLVAGHSTPASASMCMMDYSTVGGMNSALRALICGGLFCIAPAPSVNLDLIRLFNVQELNASVGQVQTLLGLLRGRAPTGSVRTLMLSGSRLPLRLLFEIRARLCQDVYFFYGSTELGFVSIGSGGVLERREGLVGYVLPGVELEIVDENHAPVAAGTEGTLRVRPEKYGYYVGASGERLETLVDGWFYPGDVAQLLPDGSLVITGRDSDVINKGGVIIAPEAVEDAFRTDARIRDVAAVGMPGTGGLEEIWVAVVADENIDFAAMRRQLAPALGEKSPDRIVSVAEIPRNDNRKVQRSKLRELLLAITSQHKG